MKNIKMIIVVISIIMASMILVSCSTETGTIVTMTDAQVGADVSMTESIVETEVSTEEPTEVPTEPPTEAPTEPEFFGTDIRFEYEYVQGGDLMPYGLFTPTTADDGEPKPMIVFLHGLGEFGVGEKAFSDSDFPSIFKRWELDGFDAYIIAPHLTGKWYAKYWSNKSAVNNVKTLLDYFITNYNVDTSNIVLTGHSSGAYGAFYIVTDLSEYFSKLAVFSGWDSNVTRSNLIKIPTRGYVENSGTHHSFMTRQFVSVFGEETLTIYKAGHPEIPKLAFTEDLDGNNRSDLVEWMFDEESEGAIMDNAGVSARPTNEAGLNAATTIDSSNEIVDEPNKPFAGEFVYDKENDLMPYMLFSPTSTNDGEELPLIVWLHGMGEIGYGENAFKKSGLPPILNDWELESFDAYVVCPRLMDGYWSCKDSAEEIKKIVDVFVEEHNVDTDRIILAGHSLGGRGAIYIAYYLREFEYFDRLVVMSGYDDGCDLSEIRIPTIGYVERGNESTAFMNGKFKEAFGEEALTIYNIRHGLVPREAFNEDLDGDGKSDLVEWMLNTKLETETQTERIVEDTIESAAKPECNLSDCDITFTSEFVYEKEKDLISYMLFTPSTANSGEAIPLIVWLHGIGEVGISSDAFHRASLPRILNNWELEGFNAYVMCPRLTNGSWDRESSAKAVGKLVDKFVATHNVNVDKIILSGHSLGGQGATYIACYLPEHFDKLVVMSGYDTDCDLAEISIPTIGYVEGDGYSYSFMANKFKSVFGEDALTICKGRHGAIPKEAFATDADGNGHSDLIEWMLEN